MGNKGGGGGPKTAPGKGVQLKLRGRQETSQLLLRWSWDGGAGAALRSPEPVPVEQALAAIADGDPRPLLVLRECEACRGTEDAFLSRTLDNEKTELLGRWFHAVRLGPEVLQPEHPLHALFAGMAPAHLFTCTLDGRTRVDLDGSQSQSQLWRAMTTVLRKAYRRDPEAAVRGLQKLLDQLDESDARLAEVEEQLLDARGEHGSESPEAQDLQRTRDQLAAAHQKLLERGIELDDLQLKTAPTPADG
jgi:hypothetical protein